VPSASRERHLLVARVAAATIIALALATACSCASAVAAGDANMSACLETTEASPGFRAFLPDCRAFEMVTPPYGGGADAWTPSMSLDGNHLVGLSVTGFAGTENLEQNTGGAESVASYEFSRTDTGWSAEALEPPASSYPRGEDTNIASPNLEKTLWKVVEPTNAGEEFVPEVNYDGWTIAVREAAGAGKGRFTRVGPVVAPGHEKANESRPAYELVGASADLTHIFLAVRAERKQQWPGDETVEGAQSLYEYRPGVSEPVLVGVSNSGLLDGSPNVNDGAQLVSQCGTAFGAASASGEVAYFTALHEAGCIGTQPAVNELWARINGSRTVKISGGEAAEFLGASEDGTKAFFTEGGSLYEYSEEEARVSLLASDVTGVSAISRDGSHVYFTAPEVLTSVPNANGEAAGEVPGEKLYVCETEPETRCAPGLVAPRFVAGEPRGGETTADGQYLVFASTRHLTGTNDASNVVQLFEYDAETDAVGRVSEGQHSVAGYECPSTKIVEEGYDCDGNVSTAPADVPTLAEIPGESTGFFLGGVSSPTTTTAHLSIAKNGAVVFSSGLALTPQAVPSRPYEIVGGVVKEHAETENIYEYRAGNVYLISPGDEVAPVNRDETRLIGIDESGEDVFFFTTDSLVPQDIDTQVSWYDAREEGGFPAPAVAAECVAEACQGPLGVAPTFAQPSTTTLAGSGNLVPTVTPTSGAKAKPKTAAEIKAEKLAKALKTCKHARSKAKRKACEATARKKYGPAKAKKATRRAK
jgi:hypothetical protein